MERLRRLHRLAILRHDLLAIAVLEGRMAAMWSKAWWTDQPPQTYRNFMTRLAPVTETELRAMWGDR